MLRRNFAKGAATGTMLACAGGGPFVRGSDKSGSKLPVIGVDGFRYECHHGWGQLGSFTWQTTHGVAVDEAGLVYIKHQGHGKEPGVDTILVFEPSGKLVRSFGRDIFPGGHGIDIRKDGNEEFLYLCDVAHAQVLKTTLKGEVVWRLKAPKESGKYDGKKRYSPTNLAFAPDGGFYVADGYGSHYVHQYDKDAKWVRTWGGAGTEPGKMKTPHGIWLDDRPGREKQVVVADRANARLQYFTLEGQFVAAIDKLVLFPAHFDVRGDVLLVPDLHARVSLLDRDNKPIVHLGEDEAWRKRVLDGFKIRRQPSDWAPGKFVHPHDACFDKAGNIFVAEWVETGRVTFLRHVG